MELFYTRSPFIVVTIPIAMALYYTLEFIPPHERKFITCHTCFLEEACGALRFVHGKNLSEEFLLFDN